MNRRRRPTTCSRPRCTDPYYSLGLCQRHYAKDRRIRKARGLLDQVDVAPVLTHIERLRRRGWTWQDIAKAGHTSHYLLGRLQRGELPTLLREKADQILAIPADWRDTALSVSWLGTGRRLDALAWQGWSGREIAARLGLSPWVFTNGAYTGTTEARVAAAVDRFYLQHADRPGPNPAYAKKARTQGAIPAAAWDDEDLDDPQAQPAGVRRSSNPGRLEAADVADLVAAGMTIDEVATRYGRKRESIEQALRRAAKREQGEAA